MSSSGGMYEGQPGGSEGQSYGATAMEDSPYRQSSAMRYGGWGGGYGMRPRRQYPIETKPFFLTSEFAALVLSIVALLITSIVDDSIDARLFWILTAGLVAAYMLSRGIAKCGTRSMSADPRENLDLGRGERSGSRDR